MTKGVQATPLLCTVHTSSPSSHCGSQYGKNLLLTRLSEDGRYPPHWALMLLWSTQPPSEPLTPQVSVTWTFHQFHHSSCRIWTQQDCPCIQHLIPVASCSPILHPPLLIQHFASSVLPVPTNHSLSLFTTASGNFFPFKFPRDSW